MTTLHRQYVQPVHTAMESIVSAWGLDNAAEAVPSDFHPNGVNDASQWDVALLEGIQKIATLSVPLNEFQSKLHDTITDRVARSRGRAGKLNEITIVDLHNMKRYYTEGSQNAAAKSGKGKQKATYAACNHIAPIQNPPLESPRSPPDSVLRGSKRKATLPPLEEYEEQNFLPSNDHSPAIKKPKIADPRLSQSQGKIPQWGTAQRWERSPSHAIVINSSSPVYRPKSPVTPTPGEEHGPPGLSPALVARDIAVPVQSRRWDVQLSERLRECGISHDMPPNAGTEDRIRLLEIHATVEETTRRIDRTRYLLEVFRIVRRGEVEEEGRRREDEFIEDENISGGVELGGGEGVEGEIEGGVGEVR